MRGTDPLLDAREAVGVLVVPPPAGSDDLFQAVARRPAQDLAGLAIVGEHGRGIARPPVEDFSRYLLAADAAGGCQYLENRRALAGADVEDV